MVSQDAAMMQYLESRGYPATKENMTRLMEAAAMGDPSSALRMMVQGTSPTDVTRERNFVVMNAPDDTARQAGPPPNEGSQTYYSTPDINTEDTPRRDGSGPQHNTIVDAIDQSVGDGTAAQEEGMGTGAKVALGVAGGAALGLGAKYLYDRFKGQAPSPDGDFRDPHVGVKPNINAEEVHLGGDLAEYHRGTYPDPQQQLPTSTTKQIEYSPQDPARITDGRTPTPDAPSNTDGPRVDKAPSASPPESAPVTSLDEVQGKTPTTEPNLPVKRPDIIPPTAKDAQYVPLDDVIDGAEGKGVWMWTSEPVGRYQTFGIVSQGFDALDGSVQMYAFDPANPQAIFELRGNTLTPLDHGTKARNLFEQIMEGMRKMGQNVGRVM